MSNLRESKTGVLIVSSLAVFTDLVIYGVIMPIIKEIIDQYPGLSEHDVAWAQGALPAVYAAGLLIFTPIFGSLSDRYNTRKIPMLLGQALLAVSTLIFAFAQSFYLCLFARFLQGIAGAATWVVGLAMLADVFNGPNLGFYMGIVFGCHNLGFLLGPLIGGFLHDNFGIKVPFYVCTALAMLDFLGRIWIKEPKSSTKEKPLGVSNSKQQQGLSMIQLIQKPEVIILNLVIILKAASLSSVETMLEVHLGEHFGYNSSQTSLVFLAFILPNILAVTVVGWISGRIRRFLIITVGLVLHPFATPLITSTTDIRFIIFGGIIFGVTLSIAGSPVSPELANIVESYGGSSYARIYGILNICYSFGMIFGPMIVCKLSEISSFFVGMLSITLLASIYSPIFYFQMKRLLPLRRQRLLELEKKVESYHDNCNREII